MPSRWSGLQTTAAGYERSGVPLVGWSNGEFVATEYKDDSGLDYFVPPLASYLHISLSSGVDVFVVGVVLFSHCLGLIGLFLILGNRWVKVWAACEVGVLALISLRTGDVYAIQSSIVILALPWTVLYAKRELRNKWLSVIFVLGLGTMLGLANFVRVHAGTTVLLFCLLSLTVCARAGIRERIALTSCLLAGMLLSGFYVQRAFAVRDTYVRSHNPSYLPGPRQHPFWHSVYIGLGFVSNPFVPGGYCDEVGINEVQNVAPGTSFNSPEYDRLLGQQVREIAMHHPYVLLVNGAAKLGIVEVMALIAGNIGLLAAVWYRKPLSLDLPFFAAAGFAFIPGILVVPVTSYILGGVAVLVLYGLISIDYALQQRRSDQTRTRHLFQARDREPLAISTQ